MKITPPFAYTDIVPFNKNQKVNLLRPGQAPAFSHGLNVLPISFSEFARAAHDYPIAFISFDQGRTFATMIIVGVEAGKNLFIRPDGAWDATVYSPAYARRYPFCMAKVTLDNVEQDQRIVCVEKRALDEKGDALFDDKGNAHARWTELEKLLHEYEVDLERSKEMCGIISDYGLLEPFNMQAVMNSGGGFNVTGMHRVDEKKLENLNASQVKTLFKKGIMGRIYAHLLSLENFARLIDRVAASPPPAKPLDAKTDSAKGKAQQKTLI